jgi:hypothetical protein
VFFYKKHQRNAHSEGLEGSLPASPMGMFDNAGSTTLSVSEPGTPAAPVSPMFPSAMGGGPSAVAMV